MRARLYLLIMLLPTACGRGDGEASPAVRENSAAAAPISYQDAAQNRLHPSGDGVAASPPPPTSPDRPLSSETRYRAVGTEPFWAVTVKGSDATLERPDKPPMHFPVSRMEDERAIRYLADGFTMTVTEGPCSDGMSDAVWADRVAVAFGEGTLKGCGGVRADF